MDAPSDEVAVEFPPLIRVYKDGRVERLLPVDSVPPGLDVDTGVSSKDAIISPESGVSVRLFLPLLHESEKGRLPIILYVHGGAFCVGSAFSSIYHSFCNSLASVSRALIVSVEYRLAPECAVPTSYLDSWAALRWVACQAAEDAWLRDHGDLDRVILAGDSAGATISHSLTMAAGGAAPFGLPSGDENPKVKVSGLALIHPYFFGKNPVRDPLWEFVYPPTPGIDDPLVNVAAAGGPEISRLGCGRVMVLLAEKDFLIERGRWYVEVLKGSRWGGAVEVVEHKDEGHVFHLMDPNCSNAKDLLNRLSSFINAPAAVDGCRL
ncbi:unnamed protein product [Victoria cruziana]